MVACQQCIVFRWLHCASITSYGTKQVWDGWMTWIRANSKMLNFVFSPLLSSLQASAWLPLLLCPPSITFSLRLTAVRHGSESYRNRPSQNLVWEGNSSEWFLAIGKQLLWCRNRTETVRPTDGRGGLFTVHWFSLPWIPDQSGSVGVVSFKGTVQSISQRVSLEKCGAGWLNEQGEMMRAGKRSSHQGLNRWGRAEWIYFYEACNKKLNLTEPVRRHSGRALPFTSTGWREDNIRCFANNFSRGRSQWASAGKLLMLTLPAAIGGCASAAVLTAAQSLRCHWRAAYVRFINYYVLYGGPFTWTFRDWGIFKLKIVIKQWQKLIQKCINSLV